MKKYFSIGLGLLALLIASLVISPFQKNWEIVHPSRGELEEAVYSLGKVKTDRRYDVIIGVLSTVQKIFVKEGDTVKVGQELIKLESSGLFRAPFAGIVTLVSANEFQTVTPNVPLLRVEDLKERYLELSLEQETALRVRVGQKARISFESLRGEVLSGVVSSIFSRQDEFLVRIQVEGLSPEVLPGMTADVVIEVGKISNALLIPIKAIQNGMVTVKRGQWWKKEKIAIGHANGLFAEVLDNSLSTEDQVKIQGGK